ncbi:MAG TPA: LptE family protein [Candidatus Hydrogenedentes bacterium]|nr:LptE family protein [Candidatus Hydrogenedentota bacterium]
MARASFNGRRFVIIMSAMRTGVMAIVMTGFFAGMTGCGYTTQSSLLPKYQTIYVSAFKNHSKEYDLAAPLTNAVIRKFTNDGRLRVAPYETADLVLEGVVLKYALRGLTYDKKDNVTQYICVITGGVRVSERQTGKVLWEAKDVTGETSYYTRASGQSSDRLRGNAEVFLATVRSFSSEEENRAASEALEQLASEIFYRTVEPW